jgi:hypothetical protein
VTEPAPQQPPSQSPFAQPISLVQREANDAARTAPSKQPQRAPSAREMADMTPQERFAIGQRELDRERGNDRILRRDARGAPYWEDQGDPANGGETPPAPADDVPKYKVGELELTEQQARDLLARDAAEKSRRLTLPQRPEDYRAENTQAFKPPPGIEFKINEADPLMGQARAFALKHGIPQDGFSEMMDLYAAGQVATQQRIKQAHDAELGKLGANATARVDSVTTWVKSQMGEDLAKEFCKYLFSAKQFEAVEKLMTNFRTQGASSYSPQHSEHATERMSDEAYDKLSFSEKRAYAAQFSQTQR